MPYPHVIRLRGPWEYEALEAAGAEERAAPRPAAGRMQLPGDWGAAVGTAFRGRVRFRRRFNPPARLDPHERAWLVIEGVDARGSAALNGTVLGDIRGYAVEAAFHVTDLIGPRNELLVDVELPAADVEPPALRPGREGLPGGLVGEVRLEIRAECFLDQLALWAADEGGSIRFHASGRAICDSERQLALVATGAGRELLYAELAAGEPFELSAMADELPRWNPAEQPCALAPVEAKLLSGGTCVWQTARPLAAASLPWPEDTQGADAPRSPREDAPRSPGGDAPSIDWVGDGQQALGLVSELRRAGGRERSSQPLVVRAVLPEGVYEVFDRAGQPLVQCLPVEWAADLCPRLAHHASIRAWAAVGPQSQRPDEHRITFGRRWLEGPHVRPTGGERGRRGDAGTR